MNRTLQLQQDKAKLIDGAGAILKAAQDEKRSMTVEEQASFDKFEADIKALNSTMDTEQRFAALSGNAHNDGGHRPAHVRENILDKPFVSFGEQLIAIANAENVRGGLVIDPRLIDLNKRAASGGSETVPSDGGFLLAPEFSDQILLRAHDTGVVAKLARKLPIAPNTNSIKIPGIDEQSRADGSRWGGVRMYWNNEADALTGSKPKFRNVELVMKKLTGLFYSTDELQADAAALGSIVMQAFGEEVGFKLDDAFINGDGSGKPLGILNAPALVTIAKESGQAAATILYANLSKMRAAMYSRSWTSSVWFINVNIMPQLEQLVIPVKNVAGTENVGGFPVYVPPSGGFTGGAAVTPFAPFGTLFGRPIQPIEQCQTLGTVGDIVLADMSQYVTADKGDMQAASSIHVRFLNDEMTYRWVYRVDGQPIWNTALTPFKGNVALSPFIALASR